jgi:beta-barrel assembly-enhancing protease
MAMGCVQCAMWAHGRVLADTAWALPERLTRPEISTDEGGLWAVLDREEQRLRRSHFVVRDHGLQEYLQNMVGRMVGAHATDVRVYPMRVPYPNATMYPNGMMHVWSGLLLRAENEAQLASVLGHELGHYLQRHGIAQLRDLKSRAAVASVVGWAGLPGLVGVLALSAGMGAYSRDHERESDSIGVSLMQSAGYDPREASKVWANLRAEAAAGTAGDSQKSWPMFATHPASDERQAALEKQAAGSQGDVAEAGYWSKLEPMLPDLVDDELKRAQYDESIHLFSRMQARRPQHARLFFARGEAFRLRSKEGDIDRALADFAACLSRERPPAQAHRALGFMHRQRGDKAAAADAFKNYLSLDAAAPDAAMVQSYLSELS